MSFTVKFNKMNFKDANGNYVGINSVDMMTPEEFKEDVKTAVEDMAETGGINMTVTYADGSMKAYKLVGKEVL